MNCKIPIKQKALKAPSLTSFLLWGFYGIIHCAIFLGCQKRKEKTDAISIEIQHISDSISFDSIINDMVLALHCPTTIQSIDSRKYFWNIKRMATIFSNI